MALIPDLNNSRVSPVFLKSRLDLENSNPDGLNLEDTVTVYPAVATGTPSTESTTVPAKRFYQPYLPSDAIDALTDKSLDYISQNPIKGQGRLKSALNRTDLDITSDKPNGGIPYKTEKDPTVYPVTSLKNSSTVINGNFTLIGRAAQKYTQNFSPKNTYLSFITAPAKVNVTGNAAPSTPSKSTPKRFV